MIHCDQVSTPYNAPLHLTDLPSGDWREQTDLMIPERFTWEKSSPSIKRLDSTENVIATWVPLTSDLKSTQRHFSIFIIWSRQLKIGRNSQGNIEKSVNPQLSVPSTNATDQWKFCAGCSIKNSGIWKNRKLTQLSAWFWNITYRLMPCLLHVYTSAMVSLTVTTTINHFDQHKLISFLYRYDKMKGQGLVEDVLNKHLILFTSFFSSF